MSIVNSDKPSVGCMYRSVAVAGTATMINYRREVPLTLIGSAERGSILMDPRQARPFTSPWTCDNGLSTSLDTVF